MSDSERYPSYIARDEEAIIMEVAERVRDTGQSESVLLYGPGGVGKTRLVRSLATQEAKVGALTWTEPIDMDDPECWLLASVQAAIARRLDPGISYFARYLEQLSYLPMYSGERASPESVVSRLRLARDTFVDCYRSYVQATGKPVVLVFDTVETIRGAELLLSLTQWMKTLPRTLFILSGRPPAGLGQDDPIGRALKTQGGPMPVTEVPLGEFSLAAATKYLDSSEVGSALDSDQTTSLVHLTGGHPLWLALTVSYLYGHELPEEARVPLRSVREDLPYYAEPTARGHQRREEFKRRILSPYRGADFWHEAFRRLSTVRQGVDRSVWQELMRDRKLPDGIGTLDQAWEELAGFPWVRQRANQRFRTVHDAMAEELGLRVLPVHDPAGTWRKDLRRRAGGIFQAQAEKLEQTFKAESSKLVSRRKMAGDSGDSASSSGDLPAGWRLLTETTSLDAGKREIDQFKVSSFESHLLCDFQYGCEQFISMFKDARGRRDLLFQELLATAMRRYLPADCSSSGETQTVVREFHDWLTGGNENFYSQIGTEIARYLLTVGQGTAAVALLRTLPLGGADPRRVIEHNLLLGNACMRAPGQAGEGEQYFQLALRAAERFGPDQGEQRQLTARAYKDLGFYRRCVGRWEEANTAYECGRNAIFENLIQRNSNQDRAEMASIQSNWAYVKGLSGHSRVGLSLVQSAIAIRQKLGDRLKEGMSLSTCGEIHRYQQQFHKAWDAYAQAETIFDELQETAWLGMIYQEQAICLFQAHCDGRNLTGAEDPRVDAEKLAIKAMDICRERAIRSYPSALNRAGRIVGARDADEGLAYLAEGIAAAREISDGWFWAANLVEYAELSYQALIRTHDDKYREGIARREAALVEALRQYNVPDLRGRWDILRAHLYMHDWGVNGDDADLDAALLQYTEGFARIADGGQMGSSGNYVIPGAFDRFREIFSDLPPEIRSQWLEHLRVEWSGSRPGSTMLMAQLERLY